MATQHSITIKAGGSEKDYWKDLWLHRQLLWILSKRDISVRYKQTLLGVAWSVLRPFMTMTVMVFVFSYVARIDSDPGVPYPLMVLSGLTIWTFFSNTFQQISNSILINGNLVSKVYFPRLLMPLSSIAVGFVDFLIALGIFIVLTPFFDYTISWQIIYIPFFVLLTFITSMGFGLFFAVLNVRFRDIGQLIPFLIQVGMYVLPVAYPSSLVKDTWYEKYYNLNPLVGIIGGFRWCLLGEKSYFNPQSLYSTVIISFSILVLSLIYFRKKENTFVDHI
ncbi:ABC transporter permease [Dyadobacter fanqingshengii]|uniref:Transport permease protein n=1 Tax=Dyadobacter fanqingshengii TaxID=2906443 RepID=A0A9X1PDV7_9BACT|nr:ABC transporter permease [Dyadobacter fanqingshengii]MCF0043396.1 ABC transporter permease [Dyadobacter fanqingshengii]MCF2504305.1 ABC transporter permease [Dyadobacter fanqingshengii]USJ35864.1 ABC transporter permease [Dyadobacter fanqingshengii]